MQESDESPSRKSLIILMMCLCVLLGIGGQFSQHWIEIDQGVSKTHYSLSSIYYYNNTTIDDNGEVLFEEGEYEDTHRDMAEFWCNQADLYQSGSAWSQEWEEMTLEYCDASERRADAGLLASIILWISTATGAWFLVVAYRSIRGEKHNLSLAILDDRFCLASGGLMTLAPLIWRVMINDSFDWAWVSVGAGFYISIVGGLLGIVAYIMIMKFNPEISEMRDAEKIRIQAENEAKAKAEADAKKVAEAGAKDAELLRVTEEAVRAKAEAEANPNDPLSWLRMAEAMDAANRHEEAERCRKTAMELMEKETL